MNETLSDVMNGPIKKTFYQKVKMGLRVAIVDLYKIPLIVLLPKRNKKVVFIEIEHEMHWAFIKPWYRHLCSDDRFIIVFLIDRAMYFSERTLKFLSKRHFVIDRRIGFLLSGGVFISCHEGSSRLPRVAAVIQIFHTPGTLHLLFHPELLSKYDHWFLAGPYQYQDAQDYLIPGISRPIHLHKVGYPKLDSVIRINNRINSRIKGMMLRSIGLSPEMPTIIYAPTWGEWSSLNEYKDNIIGFLRALSRNGFNIIVRLHPNSFYVSRFYTLGVDWPREFKSLEKTSENLHLCDRWSSSGFFLIVSDLMITDESSAGIEFACLSKPILFLKSKPKIRSSIKEPGIEITKRSEMGYETDSLEEALEVLVNGYEKIECANLRDFLLFDPGKSAWNLYYRILEITSENEST